MIYQLGHIFDRLGDYEQSYQHFVSCLECMGEQGPFVPTIFCFIGRAAKLTSRMHEHFKYADKFKERGWIECDLDLFEYGVELYASSFKTGSNVAGGLLNVIEEL